MRKQQRTPTVREIKMAICTHDRLAPVGLPAQRAAGDVWQTKVACPSCGAWSIRETVDGSGAAPVAGAAVVSTA